MSRLGQRAARGLVMVMALACGSLLAPGAAAGAPPPAAPDASAMRSLAERPDATPEALLRLIEREPQQAGAWLDLALSHCMRGQEAEAERLFREIETRFAPPPGIMEVIQAHRAQGCKAIEAAEASAHQLALVLGRGYDSNVNQGASNAIFITGSGSTRIERELMPEYLPQPDHYSLLAVDYTRQLGASHSLAIVQLRARHNDALSRQDTASLLLGAERPWRLGDWDGRATAAFGLVYLGGQLYQRQSQLQGRITPPLALPERYHWSIAGGLSYVDYPTRSKFNGSTAELSTQLMYRGPQTQGQMAGGYMADRGESGRLGGNRSGWYASLQLQTQLGRSLNAELGWTQQGWLSDSVYSPGIIEQVRRQNTRQWRAAIALALDARHSLQLELRDVKNLENISLFQYNGRLLQLSWRWQDF
jgi:hypothetical protein